MAHWETLLRQLTALGDAGFAPTTHLVAVAIASSFSTSENVLQNIYPPLGTTLFGVYSLLKVYSLI